MQVYCVSVRMHLLQMLCVFFCLFVCIYMVYFYVCRNKKAVTAGKAVLPFWEAAMKESKGLKLILLIGRRIS